MKIQRILQRILQMKILEEAKPGRQRVGPARPIPGFGVLTSPSWGCTEH